jgi:hypothetical protein
MAGFTTTSDGDWVFDFADPDAKPKLPDGPNMATSYLEGAGKWENYSDPVVYECDSLMRQFLESKTSDPKWNTTSTKWRRFTPGMMFEVLYGRKYEQADYPKILKLLKIMGYYSSRIQKSGVIRGKKTNKNVYCLSLKRYKKMPPYSLKLRLEWLQEKGELPCWQNMRLPSDYLKPGHARNKRTEENMEKRRERAKAVYNGRYKDRAH